jgi:hypothetical protein
LSGEGRHVTRRIDAGVLASLIVAASLVAPTNAVQVGQKATDFTVAGPGNKPVKLDDLLGKDGYLNAGNQRLRREPVEVRSRRRPGRGYQR